MERTQIAEVDLSSKHIYSYEIRFGKLFPELLYAVSILLGIAVS